jgi:hypothetical protein
MIKGFVTLLLIAIALALAGVFLVKKIGYRACLLSYLSIYGVILVWRSTSQGLSVLDIILNFTIYFGLSAALLFLMTNPLAKWLIGSIYQNPVTVRELCAQAVLEESPNETRELLHRLIAEADKQGTSLNIATVHL